MTHPLAFASKRQPGRRELAIAAAFLTGTLASGTIAFADEPTPKDLLEQIQKLQEQVRKLEAEQAAQQAAATQATQDATALVLEDAQRRAANPLTLSSQDDPPMIAGFDGKQFMLGSPEGDFLLVPNFQIQLRNVTNGNNEGPDELEDWENGSEVRRAKIGFKGHVFGKPLKYDVKFAFNRDGGAALLENAFIDYVPEEGLFNLEGMGVRAGQFKDITFIEESVSSSKQTLVDRSLVNETIGGGNTDFIQAVGPTYKKDRLSGMLLYTEGANSDNTPFLTTVDYGVAGRVDFAFLEGEAKSVLDDFTALGNKDAAARVGAGFHLTAAGDSRVLHHTVDGQFETAGGLALFAAYYGRWSDVDGVDALDMGGLIQASWLLGEDGWEIFGRYDFTIFEDALTLGPTSEDFFSEIAFGFNKYMRGHNSKFTVDVVYLPEGNPGSNSGIGLRPSNGEFGDQAAIRAQYQLAI